MTHTQDHIVKLLNQAPEVPASPNLPQQIMTSAMLDSAMPVPASPNLKQSILSATKIVQFKPKPATNWFNPTALAGGLMAASLILGIWTGSNGIADNLLAAPFELAGLNVTETTDEFSFYNVIDGLTPTENLL